LYSYQHVCWCIVETFVKINHGKNITNQGVFTVKFKSSGTWYTFKEEGRTLNTVVKTGKNKMIRVNNVIMVIR
jgi:hypothetical protein